MFFNQKNKWNQDVKSNFENIELWVGPISKFALVRIIVYQLKSLNLKNIYGFYPGIRILFPNFYYTNVEKLKFSDF